MPLDPTERAGLPCTWRFAIADDSPPNPIHQCSPIFAVVVAKHPWLHRTRDPAAVIPNRLASAPLIPYDGFFVSILGLISGGTLVSQSTGAESAQAVRFLPGMSFSISSVDSSRFRTTNLNPNSKKLESEFFNHQSQSRESDGVG